MIDDQNETIYLLVTGTVQHVAFRQVIMRASIPRNIIAGVTNDPNDESRVEISLQGQKDKVDEIIDALKSGEALNSLGARCSSVEILNEGKNPLEHETTTANFE